MGRTTIAVLLVLSSLSFFFPFGPAVRWLLTYLFIPGYAFLFFINNREIKLAPHWIISPFGLLLIVGFNTQYYFSILHWLIYLCSILVIILLRSYNDFMNEKFQKKLIITGIFFAVLFLPTWTLPSSFLGIFLESESIFEGNLFSFLWLPLMFSSVLNRRWKLLVFLMLIITLKRVVFLACLIFLIIEKLRLEKLIIYIFLAVALVNLSLVTGLLDALVEELTGVNSYVLTSGRRGLNSILTDSLINLGYMDYIFGSGVGLSGTLVLEKVGRFHLPHNDVLRILVDNGILGLISLLLPMRFLKSNKSRLMYGSYLFCLLTDNTTLYLTVTTIVFGLIIYEESHYITKKNTAIQGLASRYRL